MQSAARGRRGGGDQRRGLRDASFGVGVAVALTLCLFGCGQVTADRADGAGSAFGGHEAGIIDINAAPDGGRDGERSGAAGSLGAAGTTGAAGTSGAGGRSGAGGMTGPVGPGAAAGTTGSACPSPGGCPDGVCNPLTQKCVDCLIDSDCKKGKGKLCDPSALTCVECRTDADCGGDNTCGTDGSCSN